MNQLELILENIRLSHTERLLQEAQTDLELIRGQRLINESVLNLGRELSSMIQENWFEDKKRETIENLNMVEGNRQMRLKSEPFQSSDQAGFKPTGVTRELHDQMAKDYEAQLQKRNELYGKINADKAQNFAIDQNHVNQAKQHDYNLTDIRHPGFHNVSSKPAAIGIGAGAGLIASAPITDDEDSYGLNLAGAALGAGAGALGAGKYKDTMNNMYKDSNGRPSTAILNHARNAYNHGVQAAQKLKTI